MDRFKQILRYGVIIVVFAIFTNYMARIALKNMYKEISGQIQENEIGSIEVIDSKSTSVNGYVKGIVTGKTDKNLYIKLDLYSKNHNILGTEYYEIKNIKNNEKEDFKIEFQYSKVDSFEITCVNEK
jgi:hypothetical protein